MTAIIAAVLAVLVSLATAAAAVTTYNHPGAFECADILVAQPDGTFGCTESLAPEALFYLAVCAALSVLLLVGALLLFLRTTAGRVLVMVATALSALAAVGFTVADSMSIGLIHGRLFDLIPGVVSIVALGLAAAPPTGHWIRAARPRPGYHPH
ncbi:hypothetical protein [Nocardia caishijiensis]|uniref:hypothetical protein n=1 Tax=Nocardia caishijiensis TaxID=184756 RepID=UPI00082ADDA8|nr:hypothetical protein [Nocardia caishijiensis]